MDVVVRLLIVGDDDAAGGSAAATPIITNDTTRGYNTIVYNVTKRTSSRSRLLYLSSLHKSTIP